MNVLCLAQDKIGFIWVGTTDGIYRLDAHGYVHYRADLKDSLGLSESKITSLFVSSTNRLWIGMERKGIAYFDKQHNRFISVKNENNRLNNITPQAFLEDADGSIWVAIRGGNKSLAHIQPEKSNLMYYSIPDSLATNRDINGLSLSASADDNIFLGTIDGLLVFDKTKQHFIRKIRPFVDNLHTEFTISKQFIDADGSLWLSLYGYGLLHYFPNSRQLLKFPIPVDAVGGNISIVPFSNHEFLIGCNPLKKLLFNKQTGTYTFLNDEGSSAKEGFSSINDIIQSSEGIYFIGGSKGIHTLDPKNQPATILSIPGTSLQKEYKLNSVIYNPHDSCYYAGLFNIKNYSIVKWHARTLKQTYYSSIVHPQLGQYINELVIDHNGKIWCSDYYHIYLLDPSKSNLTPVFETTQFNRELINDIFIDSDNHLWIALSSSGLALLNPDFTIPKTYHHRPKSSVVYSIVDEDKEKNIWLSYSTGLSSFNQTTHQFHQYIVDNDREMIRSVMLDSGETFWMTKYGKGIYKYTPKNNQFSFYGEKDGLGSALFSNTPVVSDNGYVWTISASFLSAINKETGLFQNYSEKDLFDLAIINPDNTFMINEQNQFITATTKGILICNISQFKKAVKQPQVFINAIKVWGYDLFPNSDVNAITSIQLNHDQNNLSLGYSSLSFRQDEGNTYSYFLDGYDKEWHTTSNERQVTYTSLPSGTYTFNLKASNYAGVWDKQPKQIVIIIHPPFWQTWWFVSLMLFLILAIAYLIIRAKIRSVRAAAQLENKHNIDLMEFELKALKAQINPHFLFNALSAIQQQILSQNITDAHKYLGKFAKLLRSTLDLSDRRTIQLEDEVDLLKNYLELEKVRFKNKFTYTIEVDKHLLAENPDIPGMIVQPYIENAIIHGLLNLDNGKEGILSIQFEYLDSAIQCTITDNGVGRQKAASIKLAKGKTHASKGIAITENRINLIAKLYKGKSKAQIIDLVDSLNNAVGTQVILQIPVMTVNPT